MAESNNSWRLDKTITVPAMISLLSTVTIAIALAVSLDTRLGALEAKVAGMGREVTEARETALRVARIDERIAAMQRILGEIKVELRERRAK